MFRFYFDMVDAELMVTTSCPSWDGDQLLGAALRDITSKQLTPSVLSRIGACSRIAASNPALAGEVDRSTAVPRRRSFSYRPLRAARSCWRTRRCVG